MKAGTYPRRSLRQPIGIADKRAGPSVANLLQPSHRRPVKFASVPLHPVPGRTWRVGQGAIGRGDQQPATRRGACNEKTAAADGARRPNVEAATLGIAIKSFARQTLPGERAAARAGRSAASPDSECRRRRANARLARDGHFPRHSPECSAMIRMSSLWRVAVAAPAACRREQHHLVTPRGGISGPTAAPRWRARHPPDASHAAPEERLRQLRISTRKRRRKRRRRTRAPSGGVDPVSWRVHCWGSRRGELPCLIRHGRQIVERRDGAGAGSYQPSMKSNTASRASAGVAKRCRSSSSHSSVAKLSHSALSYASPSAAAIEGRTARVRLCLQLPERPMATCR
mgnify:CR=1 FL=1